MARGTITPYVITRAGLDISTITPTTGDVTNGHTVPNRGSLFVDVHNTNAVSTAHTVTFRLPGGADGQTITPKTVSIAATKTFRFGPFPADLYGGNLLIDVDHAELTIVAVELQR